LTASKSQVGGGHYRALAIQPSEFIHRNGLGWCEGNAIKYVCRHKAKNGRQDIEKAIHYLQLLLEWEYPDAPPNRPNPHGPAHAAVPAAAADQCGLYRDQLRGCVSCEEDI
jgi:hypothetical protein